MSIEVNEHENVLPPAYQHHLLTQQHLQQQHQRGMPENNRPGTPDSDSSADTPAPAAQPQAYHNQPIRVLEPPIPNNTIIPGGPPLISPSMSAYDQHIAANSSAFEAPNTKKRSIEEEHCIVLKRNSSAASKSSNTKYRCIYCNFEFVGGPQKIRVHLTGKRENGTRLSKCEHVPEEVRVLMESRMRSPKELNDIVTLMEEQEPPNNNLPSRSVEENHCFVLERSASAQSKSSNTKYKCIYCRFRFVGGPQKIRVHLTGMPEGGTRVAKCPRAPPEVVAIMENRRKVPKHEGAANVGSNPSSSSAAGSSNSSLPVVPTPDEYVAREVERLPVQQIHHHPSQQHVNAAAAAAAAQQHLHMQQLHQQQQQHMMQNQHLEQLRQHQVAAQHLQQQIPPHLLQQQQLLHQQQQAAQAAHHARMEAAALHHAGENYHLLQQQQLHHAPSDVIYHNLDLQQQQVQQQMVHQQQQQQQQQQHQQNQHI